MRRQLHLIRRYQAEPRHFDRSKLSKPRSVASRVLEYGFAEMLRAAPLLEYRYVLNQSSFAPQSRLTFLLTKAASIRSGEDALLIDRFDPILSRGCIHYLPESLSARPRNSSPRISPWK